MLTASLKRQLALLPLLAAIAILPFTSATSTSHATAATSSDKHQDPYNPSTHLRTYISSAPSYKRPDPASPIVEYSRGFEYDPLTGSTTSPILITREWDAEGQCTDYIDPADPQDGGGDYIDPNADGGYGGSALDGATNHAAIPGGAGGGGTGGECGNGEWKCEGLALSMCHWSEAGKLEWVKLHDCPTTCKTEGDIQCV